MGPYLCSRQPRTVTVYAASVAMRTFFLRRRPLFSETAEPEADESGGHLLGLGNWAERRG